MSHGVTNAAGRMRCTFCSQTFLARGFSNHVATCQRNAERRLQLQERKKKRAAAPSSSSNQQRHAEPVATLPQSEPSFSNAEVEAHLNEPLIDPDSNHALNPNIPLVPTVVIPQIPQQGTYVRTQFHPSSGLPDKICTLEDYLDMRTAQTPSPVVSDDLDIHDSVPNPRHKSPWFPFSTEGDFDFAEFVHEHKCTNPQIDDQLRRMRKVWFRHGEPDVTFTSHRDLDTALEAMREAGVRFETKTDSAAYNDYLGNEVSIDFEYQICSILEVIQNIVRDPLLSSHIQWYPTKRSLIIDGKEQQFIDDIDCTDDWWNIQTVVGKVGGVFFALILYADGTQAYRFGGKMFHPIILRVANLPSCIRNTTGKGGGVLVGWFPAIQRPATEKDSVSFTDFNNKVIHIVLSELFSSIRIPSQIGESILCRDNIRRRLHVGILAASLDFEEATAFALTRGSKGLVPCPICLVPNHELNIISRDDRPRSQKESIAIYKETEPLFRRYGSITLAENVLMHYGTRPIRNAFWSLHNSDIHKVIAYDLGHGIDGGLFKRIYLAMLVYVSRDFKDRVNLTIIDDRFSKLKAWGRWPQLEKITEISYVDQRTWVCIFMRILGVMWDLDRDNRRGMRYVLTCMRALACLRCLLGIHFVLAEHLDLCERYKQEFAESLPNAGRVLDDDLNIPKMHLLLQHSIDHIRRKGPLKDIGTMLGEHGHVEVHQDFERVGGFESEKQVVKLRETRAMFQVIRDRVNAHHKDEEGNDVDLQTSSEPSQQRKKAVKSLPGHPILRSPRPKIPSWELDQIEAPTGSLRALAFRNSSQQLVMFLKTAAGENSFPQVDFVHPHESVQICYRSLSTQSYTWEYARCADKFYNKRRYDCILVNAPTEQFFARVHGLYSCVAFNKTWSLARITRLKRIEVQRSQVIGFPHVREERSGIWIDVS